MTIEQCEEFYINTIDKIFESNKLKKIFNKITRKEMGYSGMIKNLLNQYMGGKKLTDVPFPKVILCCTNVTNKVNNLFLFKNFEKGITQDVRQDENIFYTEGTSDALVADAVRSTTAAPIFLKEHKIKMIVNNEETFVTLQDGGLLANNPTYCTLIEINVNWSQYRIDTVVSLGTGEVSEKRRKDGVIIPFLSGLISTSTNQKSIHKQVLGYLREVKKIIQISSTIDLM